MKTKLKAPEHIVVFYSDFMKNILTSSYSKETKIRFKLNSSSIVVSATNTFEKILPFDICILHALHTIFMNYGCGRLFGYSNILKILTGNSQAHFSINTKKAQSLSKEIFKKSVKKLCEIQILEINNLEIEEKQLLPLNIDEEYLSFFETPTLLNIYRFNNILSIKKGVYDINALYIKSEEKKYIHQTVEFINYKFFILQSIAIANGEEIFELKGLRDILRVSQKKSIAESKLKQKLISYDIFLKQIRKIENEFRTIYIYGFCDLLKKYRIIKMYKLKGEYLTLTIK